mmetsp:Transcript_26579/g.45367  ORF Transcript_26579/g.45367 Transcript_26579/m.45367 type:complete len:208 (+) Transcript_26579:773-1396(+)
MITDRLMLMLCGIICFKNNFLSIDRSPLCVADQLRQVTIPNQPIHTAQVVTANFSVGPLAKINVPLLLILTYFVSRHNLQHMRYQFDIHPRQGLDAILPPKVKAAQLAPHHKVPPQRIMFRIGQYFRLFCVVHLVPEAGIDVQQFSYHRIRREDGVRIDPKGHDAMIARNQSLQALVVVNQLLHIRQCQDHGIVRLAYVATPKEDVV